MTIAAELTGLITGVVGVGGALAGVLLTERGQRQMAHEARVWEQQAQVYVQIIAWGRNVEYAGRAAGTAGAAPDWRDLPDLSTDTWDRAWAYASVDILAAANNLRRTLDPVRDGTQPGPDRLRAIEQAARDLRILARTELQTGSRAGRRRSWLRLRLRTV